MKDLLAVEDRDTLKYVVRHELKSFGIKVPKEKRSSVRCTQAQGKERSAGRSTVFGCPLDEIPAVPLNAYPGSAVPKFLVDCVQFLQDNIDCEGLFRKPGSRARQKDLQHIIENEGPIPTDAHVHDVAGLFKLFFRELPEPLLSGKLAEALLKCQQLLTAQEVHYTTQLLCLTLPATYYHTLRYAMQFLKQVAGSVSSNRMDASNLALVMTPNLMGGLKADKSGGTSATEKLLRLQTAVIRHLIENADDIGMVPDAVAERVESFGNRSSCDLLTDRLTSEDELDKSGEGALEERKKNRRRRRSGPIQGIMSGIGHSLGILKSGAGSAVNMTPAADEVIENPSFLGETPRILRSSKRKASEDLGTFSSAKRKAMLHQMTTDPQYSKPGLSLHREGRQGMTLTDSPITPLRPSRPALGEVDAVTEDGATVFKFQTPSIKFADESFTTFCATPPGKEGIVGATPGKKLGKLNPLSSRKYKRRSGALHADVSTPKSVYSSYTPKSGSVYQSIKKKLGHRHTRTQPTPIQLNDMPDKSVGWRLANPPAQEDPAALDSLALGNSPHLKRTPLTRRRQRRRKTPSSPATLFSPRPAISHPVLEQRSQFTGQMSSANDSESPKVVVVDLKSSQCSKTSHDDVSDVCLQDEWNRPIGKDEDGSREGLAKSDVDSRDMNEDVSQITENGSCGFESAQLHKKDTGSLRSDMIMDLTSSDSSKFESHTEATGHRQLQQSVSQKSLSSVLSQVSMDSTKSVFSVEIDYETASAQALSEDANDVTVQNDETLKDTRGPVELEYNFQLDEGDAQVRVTDSVLEDVDCGTSKIVGQHSRCNDNDEIDGLKESNEYLAQAGSMLSLDSAVNVDGNDEHTGSLDSLKTTGQSGRLVKSVSVDSGKGLSLDNLANFDEAKLQEAVEKRIASERGIKSAQDIPQGLVKMLSERLSPVEDASEESSCSVSSEDNPQFRETKAFWKLARTGHIFNKSLSDSQVNSPARRAGPTLPSPMKSYHSQVHIAKRDRFGQSAKPMGNTSLNLSNVKSNIDMFNSMCQQISPVRNLQSRSVHKGSQEAEKLSSKRGLAVPTPGETSKHESSRVQPKTKLVKSISIDSGMCNVGGGSSVPEIKAFRKIVSPDHNDSYEMALSHVAAVDIPRGLQNSKRDEDVLKPASSETVIQYENAEEMPVHHDGSQDIDQIPEHLAPVHALHNEALTPLKLASSTIIRSPGKKALKIKHRSPLKCLKIPNNQDLTPTFRETRAHKRYPCSPKNPLFRQQASARQERSLIPNHVRDDMDVVEL
ncbi:uncharacterized protein LOC119720832 [Patiria miniata]|uniref:Rho-GAP domain-containing protein n=1 Tax=Patiria miniata TaxID=46514 RepID=A0A913Z6H9_PATMI|nr:uncharacterized protein LOC119720832 [Patiria miniata]